MAAPTHILVVEHNPCNLDLLNELLNQAGYQALGATTLEEFDRALSGEQQIGLALVDIAGFDRRIWDCCELLQVRKIPLLIIAARSDIASAEEEEIIKHGARGVLTKPVTTCSLVSLLHTLLEKGA